VPGHFGRIEKTDTIAAWICSKGEQKAVEWRSHRYRAVHIPRVNTLLECHLLHLDSTPKGWVSKYAELGQVLVKAGQRVKAGQVIALVGSVLNPDKITEESPPYIQRLRENGNQSMLHFELYQEKPTSSENYLGGNFFRENQPDSLLDAGSYLEDSSLQCLTKGEKP
jgi:hypothetical protein